MYTLKSQEFTVKLFLFCEYDLEQILLSRSFFNAKVNDPNRVSEKGQKENLHSEFEDKTGLLIWPSALSYRFDLDLAIFFPGSSPLLLINPGPLHLFFIVRP